MYLWHLENDTPRRPSRPRTGEVVELLAGTAPIESNQRVWIKARVRSLSGAERELVANAEWTHNQGGNSYWRARIGPFRAGEVVHYAICGAAGEHLPILEERRFRVRPRLSVALLLSFPSEQLEERTHAGALRSWLEAASFPFALSVGPERLLEIEAHARGGSEEELLLEALRERAEGARLEIALSSFFDVPPPLWLNPPSQTGESRIFFGHELEHQLRLVGRVHRRLFGHPPAGFWPPHGALDPASAVRVAATGARWVAARGRALPPMVPERISEGGHPMILFHVDEALSEALTQAALRDDPGAAARAWIAEVKRRSEGAIASLDGGSAEASSEDPVLTVALDARRLLGRADRAAPFLRALAEAFEAERDVEPTSPSVYLAEVHRSAQAARQIRPASLHPWEPEDRDLPPSKAEARGALRSLREEREAHAAAREPFGRERWALWAAAARALRGQDPSPQVPSNPSAGGAA